MSSKKKILKNGFASAVLKGVKISEQLLLVPFFISAWGAAYYGEWLTLTIIPTIIGLSDLGFGTAAANTFILKYVAGDKKGAADVYRSGMLALHMIILLSILVSVIIVFVCSFYGVFDKSLINRSDAIISVSILMFAKIITFYKQLFDAYFKASRKFNVSINLQTVYSFCVVASSILVLVLKGGIILYALVNLILTVIYVAGHAIMAKRTLPVENYKGTVVKSEIRSLVNIGMGYLLAPVWQAIFFQGTTFVVRIVLGPVAVTIFNTVRTLTRAIYQANSLVVGSVIPELQFAIGTDDLQKARKLFRFSVLVISVISIAGMIFLLTGGPWFYEVWTRKALTPPSVMWTIFIVGILFNSIWTISSEVILAANKPYRFTIAGAIVATISVIISYFLSVSFGLSGAAAGSLAMDVLLCIYVLPYSCALLKQPLSTFIGDIVADIKNISSNEKLNNFLRRSQ